MEGNKFLMKKKYNIISCWAFSATETIESVWALANHPLITLSEQQVKKFKKKK